MMRPVRLAAALWLSASAAAFAAGDCGLGGCIDVTRLPAAPTADLGAITLEAQRFFGVEAKVYIVSSAGAGATLPYYAPALPPIIAKGQVHIPEIYHAITEATAAGQPHYIWHYIVGHELAHAFQDQVGLIEAMTAPVDSVVIAELHADYLAGFFMASRYDLSAGAVDQLLREMKELPSGRPGEPSYHGEVGQRFFAATQGALLARSAEFDGAAPDAAARVSAEGVRCVFDILGLGREDPNAPLCQ